MLVPSGAAYGGQYPPSGGADYLRTKEEPRRLGRDSELWAASGQMQLSSSQLSRLGVYSIGSGLSPSRRSCGTCSKRQLAAVRVKDPDQIEPLFIPFSGWRAVAQEQVL